MRNMEWHHAFKEVRSHPEVRGKDLISLKGVGIEVNGDGPDEGKQSRCGGMSM